MEYFDYHQKRYAYLDEYGTADLNVDKSGTSTYYIVTAIIVTDESIDTSRSQAEIIRKKYFQTGEMKSSSVSKNDKRRQKIIQGICNTDIAIYTLCVDKRQIKKDSGLIYKRPFLKFIQGQLYSKLYKAYPIIEVFADEHGSREFMSGFQKYVRQIHQPQLFNQPDLMFVNSRNEVMLQVADFVSGTLARYFDPKLRTSKSDEFLSIIQQKIIGIDEWPIRWRDYQADSTYSEHNGYDNLIRNAALKQAFLFLEENGPNIKNNDIRIQIEALKYLLYHSKYINGSEYISTAKLRKTLAESAHVQLSEHQIRSDVIAKLRDSGVLIASSSKGYKIPTTEQDIIDFVNQATKIIEPMLARLARARKELLIGSENEFDILSKDEFSAMHRLISNSD